MENDPRAFLITMIDSVVRVSRCLQAFRKIAGFGLNADGQKFNAF